MTNSEGNHGEDVKEYYFYLDSTPTHSYMKYLYKYPQAAYPYEDLLATNRRRTCTDFEYELLDTGVFDENRYFDVFVEYAKETPEDLLVEISICNRGPEASTLHVLPSLWFRNTWSWAINASHDTDASSRSQAAKMALRKTYRPATHTPLPEEPGDYYLYCQGGASLMFTENDTNNERIFGTPNAGPYVKDAFNNYLVNGQQDAINPEGTGTKAAAHYCHGGRGGNRHDQATPDQPAATGYGRSAGKPL